MTIDDVVKIVHKAGGFEEFQSMVVALDQSESATSDVNKYESPARVVLNHLNTLNGTKLTAIGKIAQRLSEGYSVSDLKRIAEVKCEEWADNKTMAKYLKPQTLYGSRNKVDKYLDQVKLDDNFHKKQLVKTRPDTIVLPEFN